MVTIAEIEETLEKGNLSPTQSRAIAKAIELAQRKTQMEVETDLRTWMEDRFVTKVEFQREMGILRAEFAEKLGEVRAEIIKWMFIFWIGQIAVLVAVVKLLGK